MRAVPATLVNPSTVTYQDFDGDSVAVTFSKPILTSAAVANAALHFNVGGDWIASCLVAGAVSTNAYFGDADDAKIPAGGGIRDQATVSSSIGAVTIGGHALGTQAAGDHFGIVAEQIGTLEIGDTAIPLTAGNSNDDVFLGVNADFEVNEV